MEILTTILILIGAPLIVGAIVYYLCMLFPPSKGLAQPLGVLAALVAFLIALGNLGHL